MLFQRQRYRRLNSERFDPETEGAVSYSCEYLFSKVLMKITLTKQNFRPLPAFTGLNRNYS